MRCVYQARARVAGAQLQEEREFRVAVEDATNSYSPTNSWLKSLLKSFFSNRETHVWQRCVY